MISYLIRYNERDQDYSVIRLDAASPGSRIDGHTVQTGIRTREKAEAARQAWQAPSPAARVSVSAAGILLERGWGKAPQPHTGEDGDIRVIIRTIPEGRDKD